MEVILKKLQLVGWLCPKLGDNQILKRVFEEIAPSFCQSKRRYTRVMKLGRAFGDSAEMGDSRTC